VRLSDFDWDRIAALLNATASTKLRGVPEAIALNWADRQFVMHENGGEYNVTCREADGSGWELDFSISYTRWRAAIGPATFAYRVRCVIESRQIDYEVDLDNWVTSPGLSHAARVLALREIADDLDRQGASGLHRAHVATERLFQAASPAQSVFYDILRRLELSAEEIESRVRRVLEQATAAQVRELDGAVRAARDIPGGHHVTMKCECTSRSRGRGCIACQFKRGPLPELRTPPSG
jgi:hypothetical protein